MITKTGFNNDKCEWINSHTTNQQELAQFFEEYQINQEILAYSLDENERAHLEYDRASNTFLLIYNVPNRAKIDNHYETIPMTFIVKDNILITISNDKNEYVIEMMNEYIMKHSIESSFKFLFSSLFLISDSYFPLVEEMNRDRKRINDKLREKTTKQNLLGLSDLEIGIVYFVSASKQNAVLLEQVRTSPINKILDDSEKEQFEDALIEARQLVEMTQLASQILQQLSTTYNNVLNNNLNDIMRVLTVLSVLLTVPTIITGFFGMNMPLPLEHNALGWFITIVISVALWIALSYILRKIMK